MTCENDTFFYARSQRVKTAAVFGKTSWRSAAHLGKIGFAGSRGPIQQQATPGLPLAREELRKLDWQDDSFLQGILCCLQPSNIVPLHSNTNPS